MIRRDTIKKANGAVKTEIRVVKSFRPGPGLPPKQMTVRSFGYLEDQPDQEAFMNEVVAFNQSITKGDKKKSMTFTIPVDRKNNDVYNKKYNYGYRFLESIYDKLDIKGFFETVDFKGEYSLNDVFEFLTLRRIMSPCSKRATLQEIKQFYNKEYDFTLADAYRALDKFSDVSIKLQKHLNDKIKALIGRDSSYAFYDVTNYYFEKDFPEAKGEYQQRGVSKEHRIEPIIQLGLFMDSNNLPIAMSTFPGNTSDSITLQPAMADIKSSYNLGRLIVVADKGLNSTNNIDYIVNNGDGYVVSQILRGTKGNRYHEIMFDEEGYVGDKNFKYKMFEEEYSSHINSKKTTTRKRKVLIYWDREDAEYARKKRNEKLERANKSIQNNAYGLNHGSNEYVTSTHFVSNTGEIGDQEIKSLDVDKVYEDEKFDGYFCIITSEMDYDYKKILEVYGNLWRIEESFRITKSDLETRPIYVKTKEHIEGHMLVCFTALMILRLLQYKLKDNEISANRIKRVLNSCTCVLPNEGKVMIDEVGGMISFKEKVKANGEVVETLDYDEARDVIRNDYQLIQKSFGLQFDCAVSTREGFNKYLRSISFKLEKNKKSR
jgi:transposase